jgi:hypothetical protein
MGNLCCYNIDNIKSDIKNFNEKYGTYYRIRCNEKTQGIYVVITVLEISNNRYNVVKYDALHTERHNIYFTTLEKMLDINQNSENLTLNFYDTLICFNKLATEELNNIMTNVYGFSSLREHIVDCKREDY